MMPSPVKLPAEPKPSVVLTLSLPPLRSWLLPSTLVVAGAPLVSWK